MGDAFASGTFSFYTGSDTQTVDPYLDTVQDNAPAYRGICYGVFKRGYVGDTTNIKPWSFEVTRIPNGLALTGGKHIVNSYDANPMNVAYEILSNADWGYGYPAADVDTTELISSADTLYQEGNGFSLTLGRASAAETILHEIERQCDCKFRLDLHTGRFTTSLIRDGYSIEGLKVANDNTILNLQEYSRSSWEGTTNNVRIQYSRRANMYTEGYAPAQDLANMRAQGRKISATFSFPGVKDDDLANALAWREIRSNSYPLAKARMAVNRTFWDTYIGEVILFTYTSGTLDIDELPMRVIKVDYGEPTKPEITIDVVQDVFAYTSPSFTAPVPSGWVAPETDLVPFPFDEQLAFEAPYAISRREEYPAEHRVWCGGASQGRQEDGADILQRNGGGTPSGSYYDAGSLKGFMQFGELTTQITPNATSISVTTELTEGELLNLGTSFEIGNDLTNLILVGDEFVGCLSATDVAGGVTLNTVYRGMLDSAQKYHAAGEPIYFISLGGATTDTSFPEGNNVDIKLLPYRDGSEERVSETDPGLTIIDVDLDFRERKPYPPTEMEINTSAYPASTQSLDYGSGVDGKGIDVDFNRRDYRIYDELSQLSVDASTLVGDFPSNNSTEYRVRVYNDPDGANTLIYTSTWQDTTTFTITRTKMLAQTAGVIPSTLRVSITARHTDDHAVVREAIYDLYYDFDVESTELSPDNNWGVVSVVDTYTANWTAPDTGNYAFTLGTSGPSVWASVNDGTATEIISAGNTSGSLTGVTASDTIKIKYNGTVAGDETMVTVESPVDIEDAYVIFE
ncbi:MAG: hypothetical protein KAS32_11195 [Candidatus Peribacteraceae bacterium]|nr:hypothetical protein [Candidatus Peribacteraceae bacterium]